MKVPLVISLYATICVPAIFAQAESKPEPYAVKNKSTFNVKEGTRVPFWPIGWSKEKLQSKEAAPVAPVAKVYLIEPKDFKVTSVLLAHPPLAMISGRSYGEGEYLPVQAGGQPLKVVVKAIRDGGVWLDQSGHQIFVPLKREEIPNKPPVDPKQADEHTIKIGGASGG